MNKYIYITLSIILLLFSLSFVSCQENYGKIKTIPKSDGNVTIEDLIDKWDDYNIYYSDIYEGYNVRAALGVMFDPKNNETTLVGDRWKKVKDKKDLIEMTQWIYSNTQYEPWLNEILGSDGKFYGYLYYSYGFVTLKVIDDKKMYVFNLEERREEGDGDTRN